MSERIVRFLDASLELKAICTEWVSLRYTKEFCGAGEFRLVLPSSAAAVPEPDEYVVCEDGAIYVAEKVSKDSLTGEITVSGRGVLSLLSRRIVPQGFMQVRSVERGACYLVNRYAASVFPAPVSVAEPTSSGAVILVVEAGDLYERVVHLVSSVRKGISLTYDGTRGEFRFAVAEGADRRIANTAGNDALFLSEGFGTLAGVCEVTDRSKYANRITVRGSMSSTGAVYSTTVDARDYVFPDGFDDTFEEIREGYVKSGIGVTMFTSTDGEGNRVFDSEAYFNALRERGREELAKRRVTLSIEARLIGGAENTVEPGDICTLSTPASSVGTVRVTKVEYEFGKGKEKCVASLLAIA